MTGDPAARAGFHQETDHDGSASAAAGLCRLPGHHTMHGLGQSFFLHFPPCKVHSLPPFMPGVVLDSSLFTVSALVRTSHFLLLYTILAFQETELYDL